MPTPARRRFLQLAGGAALGSALPGPIAQALSIPARRGTGTLRDVEHVVIFMQENRSFDHYFGTLRGVRGFSDPRPLKRPDGGSVFHQPRTPDSAAVVTPFRMDVAATSAQSLHSLDHSWKGSHDLWKWHDAWIPVKSDLTMGHFTRADIPFYYALADAFTVCDAYHCSIFGPTNPNRMFLFTGTSGLAVGNHGPQVAINPPDESNDTSDPSNDAKAFAPYTWPTYAERLQAAGVSWRVYQEYDNYGDNALAYFASFRALDPTSPLYQRGRAWAEGSTAANAETTRGEHLVAQFARDVADDRLPQVSWIVAPTALCEHPSGTPGAGEDLTARLIGALTANPDVWAKTVLILNYDENDGFFDHMPPLTPPIGTAPGKSTVSLDGELYEGQPVGFGPRVPMIVVSPWTKGGWVNSQVFDHTSVIRLLETRFGVAEPNITPWRRAMAGDLTSVFDFAASETPGPPLPDASHLPARAVAQASLPPPQAPAQPGALPRQEPGARPARALPYAFDAWARRSPDGLDLTIANGGQTGAGLVLYPAEATSAGPWFYAVEAARTLSDRLPVSGTAYDLTMHGPNGFVRRFRGGAGDPLEVRQAESADPGLFNLVLLNRNERPLTVRIANAYADGQTRTHVLAPGAQITDAWPIAPADHWYDLTVTVAENHAFLRQLAGHVETGRPSRSDPALEWATA